MSRVREINIKNRMYYFFDDIFSMENLDPSNIKIDNKLTKIFLPTALDM